MAVTSDYANLYVTNQGNNTVVHFTIGLNGVLTKRLHYRRQHARLSGRGHARDLPLCGLRTRSGGRLTGLFPLLGRHRLRGFAADPQSGRFQRLCEDILVPTGVTVLANNSTVTGNAVFVTAYDQSAYNPGGTVTSTANPGWVFGFSIGSGGVLTAAANSPYEAGVKPSAIASDPTDRFVYVTDYASNELIGYSILDGSTLSFLINGPFKTGNEPHAVVIDPRGKFIYVANALDSTVSPYAIDWPPARPRAR